MANRTSRTPKKVSAFLGALRDGLSINAACKASGVARRTAYDWREADPEFRKAWDDAVETGTDELEDVAIARAKDSSDTLLIFLLKARRPDKYKDRVAKELSGPGGGPVQVDLTNYSDEDLAALKRLIGPLAGGTGDPDEGDQTGGGETGG